MKDATVIAVVIDRSGSMAGKESDTIGGYNAFLEEQKKLPGEARITTMLFNTEYGFVTKDEDVRSARPLSLALYRTSGMTALYDAVGRTITELGERLALTPEEERPSKVLVAILTDGQENSSKEFSGPQVAELLVRQRDQYGWEFLFLAAGPNAFRGAQDLGIDTSKTVMFANTGGNARAAYAAVSRKTGELRSAMSAAAYKGSTLSMSADFAAAGGEAQNPAPDPDPAP
jgi:hypothetical protein